MAVQAQYPSHVLLLNRNEQEEQRKKEMDYDYSQQQKPPLFFSNGAVGNNVNGNGNGNGNKKRMREAPMATTTHHPINVFSLQSQPSMISLSQLQLQTQVQNSLVSTGLRLSLEEQNQQTYSPLMSSSAFFSDELSAQINHQKEEIDSFILAQGEQLRRTLAEKKQRHYRALLGAAEESASRRLREKEAELERSARRAVELEDRLARLRTESMAWQAKAMAEQAAAVSLHAQLQQAASAAPSMIDEYRDSPAEDAESAHVDPDRHERLPSGTCRACGVSPVSVVLLPCRHLCLCAGCDAVTAGQCCPVCRFARTGSVQVFFS